jgi:DNA repair protein RecN (Recombination protein N)
MLRTLRIRQLLIASDVTVEFEPGLNLLTGETGAGKSILVEALDLVAGKRADRSLIRSGEERAIVEALFEVGPDSPVAAWAREQGIEDLLDGGELLVRRELPAQGNGRISINGSPATLGMLRRWGGRLVELHGQHEHQSLLSPENHLEILDRFGDHRAEREAVRTRHDEVLAVRERCEALAAAARDREARIERLEETLREIDAVDPQPGELEQLDRERGLLRNAARVAELLGELVRLTHDGEPTAASITLAAARRAEELAGIDPGLSELARRLVSASLELQDVGATLRDYSDGVQFEPGRLDEVEERRVALERLFLRFGSDEPAVLEHRVAAAAELATLRGIDAELERAGAELREAGERYLQAAAALGVARRRSATRLARAVEAQLKALALGKARLAVGFDEARGDRVEGLDGNAGPLNRRGAERVELQLAANPGEPPAPLQRAASGGELSRVMLALHAVVEGAGEGRVLVFDEVDAGTGGAVADAVGARLDELAARHQVLCVTHLPQVAVYADRHLVVSKSVRSGRTRAAVATVEGEARVAELARMLGGKEATDTSRRHAAELLQAAGAGKPGRGS